MGLPTKVTAKDKERAKNVAAGVWPPAPVELEQPLRLKDKGQEKS